MDKHDELMLRELVKRWVNHKVMVRWLSRFFAFLDFHYIHFCPPLKEVGFTCFCDLFYQELYGKVRDTLTLIMQDRVHEQIDHDLLKNVYDIFAEIPRQMGRKEIEFEAVFLNFLDDCHFLMVSNRDIEDPCLDYMLKGCLKGEKDRVSHYLHSSSEPKLLENVQHELLSVYANQKDNSGCHAFLRDDKDQLCVLLELTDAELATELDTSLVNMMDVLLELTDAELATELDTSLVNMVDIENGEHVATTMMDELPLVDNKMMEQSKRKKKKKAKAKKTVTETQPRTSPQDATHDSPSVQSIAPPIATKGHRSCLEDLVRTLIRELSNVRNDVITLRDEVIGQRTDNMQMREAIDGLKKEVKDLTASMDQQDQAAEAYIPPWKKPKVTHNVGESLAVDPPICPLPNPGDLFPNRIEEGFRLWIEAGVGYVDIGVYDAPPSFFRHLMTYSACLESEHINGYMLLLRKRAKAYPARYPQKTCNVDTWFLQNLECLWKKQRHDIDNIDWVASNAIKIVDRLQPADGRVWADLDELYMPVNIKNQHWIAGRVDFKGRLVELIDSCERYASDETI